MKKIIFLPALIAFMSLISCQKGDDVSSPSSSLNLVYVSTSVAAFAITNKPSDYYITEGKNLKIENTSKNAVSYHWDFGNGITAEGKTPPKDIHYIPCGGYYTITLTTKNVAGETSVCSQSYTILCSGRNTHGEMLPD